MQSFAAAETGLTITNPLVLYRALVATKKIESDPAQHRLALHLQKLYHRLKDYEPEVEYRYQLEQVTRTLGRSSAAASQAYASTSAESDSDNGNVAFSRRRWSGLLDGFRQQRADAASMALTRKFTSQETAMNLDSPQGLLLYGEVGTGKSMLIDLLADSLPNRKKRRYHFNAFMLDTFARIEQQRILRSRIGAVGDQSEHMLLAMARDLIYTSPILFLDEFQLPDRAASKIIANLFTSFFQLGGVLVATSNRMPEELSKASGIEFAMPSSPTSRLGFSGLRGFLNEAENVGMKGVNSRQSDFTQFLDVLKARCETWNMESKTDFRRREFRSKRSGESNANLSEKRIISEDSRLSIGTDAIAHGVEHSAKSGQQEETSDEARLPAFYFVNESQSQISQTPSHEDVWQSSILRAVDCSLPTLADVPWQRDWLHVYGRKVSVPQAHNGTCIWTFNELCNTYLGPADYITLASTYHTLVLTEVPMLKSVQKNEARRFITLLDALYESRCRLLIRAEAGPDDLFFPDQRSRSGHGKSSPHGSPLEQGQDGVYAETLSEIYQDQTNPFRPNTSSYGAGDEIVAAQMQPLEPHRSTRSVLADEDADFGPVYGAGRSAGASTYSNAQEATRTNLMGSEGPNFQKTQSFTGQDEKFAYKRAESRLWELCSQGWWQHAETGSWWQPLPREARAWETQGIDGAVSSHLEEPSSEGNERLFRHGASPFRVHDKPPPKLSWTHVWGMMQWGRKAGTWGKGVDGFEERVDEKQREKETLDRIQPKPRNRA